MTVDSSDTRPMTAPPRFTLIVPPGWRHFDLTSEDSATRIRDLLTSRSADERRTGRELEAGLEMIDHVVAAARTSHASMCALYSDLVGTAVIGASLLTTAVEIDESLVRDGTVDVDALRSRVTATRGIPVVDCAVVHLPAGPAVRAHSRPELTSSGQTLRADNVQYFVPMPGEAVALTITFSTPTLAMADAFGELFDAIAASLAWLPRDDAAREAT